MQDMAPYIIEGNIQSLGTPEASTLLKGDWDLIPFRDHLALAGSMPFKLGWAFAIKSSVLDLGSRSKCMGEVDREFVLVCGTFQSGSVGIGEKRT